MNTALLEAVKEAYACAPSDEVHLETLEISHPGLPTPIRLVKNRENITATLETEEVVEFEGAAFRMSRPAAGENGLQVLTLSIDDVDRRVSDFMNAAKAFTTPVTCVFRPYLASDLSEPQMDPPLVLYLRDISADDYQVTAKATFTDLLNRRFPSECYVRSKFPSLGG